MSIWIVGVYFNNQKVIFRQFIGLNDYLLWDKMINFVFLGQANINLYCYNQFQCPKNLFNL